MLGVGATAPYEDRESQQSVDNLARAPRAAKRPAGKARRRANSRSAIGPRSNAERSGPAGMQRCSNAVGGLSTGCQGEAKGAKGHCRPRFPGGLNRAFPIMDMSLWSVKLMELVRKAQQFKPSSCCAPKRRPSSTARSHGCHRELPPSSLPSHRSALGSLRTTTVATSKSSSSMKAARPSGPKAAGTSASSCGRVPT